MTCPRPRLGRRSTQIRIQGVGAGVQHSRSLWACAGVAGPNGGYGYLHPLSEPTLDGAVLPRRGGSRPAQYLASIGPGLGSLLKEICQVILQTDHTLRLHTQKIQMFTFLDMNATSTSLPPPLAQKA